MERNMTLYPIEVKKTAMPNANDFKSFSVLKKTKLKAGTGALICLYPELMPLAQNIISVPVWEI
jgi:hypothetical protein